ncbi:MAG: ribonuclease HI [Pseudomonadota bacterium]
MTDKVVAYTDGACSGNPGPGGWGVLLIWGDHEKELSGGEAETTNNRMELLAAIKALDSLKRDIPIEIVTDSAYLKNGITDWLRGWKARGWRTADKKPVKNQDLWQALDEAVSRHDVTFTWIKGHAGHDGNERADALARTGMAPYKMRRPKLASDQ